FPGCRSAAGAGRSLAMCGFTKGLRREAIRLNARIHMLSFTGPGGRNGKAVGAGGPLICGRLARDFPGSRRNFLGKSFVKRVKRISGEAPAPSRGREGGACLRFSTGSRPGQLQVVTISPISGSLVQSFVREGSAVLGRMNGPVHSTEACA